MGGFDSHSPPPFFFDNFSLGWRFTEYAVIGYTVRMASIKQKLVFIVLFVGAGLMAFGLKFHTQPVFSEDNDKGLVTPETRLMKEVSIGGLQRDPAGNLRLTYTGKPPEACPT